MLPFLEIGREQISTFKLCILCGLVAFFLFVIFKVKKSKDLFYLLPKICLAFGVGCVGSIVFDGLVNLERNNGFKWTGMTFYGGLIAGVLVLIVLLAIFKKNRTKTITEWLDLLVVPFLLFHFFGRIGCFMGGCCYGKETTSVLGIVFPDNVDTGIIHGGVKVFPTQLFEAVFLLSLAIIVFFVNKHNFTIYCYAYPIFRFFIEYLRGDNRGCYFGVFSPSQLISVMLVITYSVYIVWRYIHSKGKRSCSP